MLDPAAPDDPLGTMALTRLLVLRTGLPVIAAGGIMDGTGIRAALALGATAAQLGTAFVSCPESGADAAYRSGRPARCLANLFARRGTEMLDEPPDYPTMRKRP